jgi:hypothetical protein
MMVAAIGCGSRSTREEQREEAGALAPTCDSTSHDARATLCAANAFLATLSDSQRRAVVVPFTIEMARRWSNLPCSIACRNGLLLGSLTDAQRDAALRLVATALSGSGLQTHEGLRKADSLLAQQPSRGRGPGGPPAGPPPGGNAPPPGGRSRGVPGGLRYGEGNYVVAFLGAPSDTGQWILQLGGHHLAIHVTYRGGTSIVSATPFFVGVEPQSFTVNGTTYAPVQQRKAAMYSMINALTPEQRTAAQLDVRFDDVIVGPGRDGQFPTSQGLEVSRLTAQQQSLVKAAIEAWVKDVPDPLARTLLQEYSSPGAMQATRIAWSGSTDSTVIGSYLRIDGPRVWIEFVCQQGVVFRDQIHFHTIWRDKQKDYGGSFAF